MIGGSRYITCLQSLFKIHPDFDGIVKRILDKNPDIKLLMLDQFGKSFIADRFTEIGINLEEQIVFLPKMKREVFLKVLDGSVAALDPLYFGSGNTMYEAFSLGLPLVTLPGRFMRGRAVYGAYQQVGVSGLVADSPEDYVDRVSRLINDDDFRNRVCDELNAKSHLLFNNSEVIEEFREHFLKMAK